MGCLLKKREKTTPEAMSESQVFLTEVDASTRQLSSECTTLQRAYDDESIAARKAALALQSQSSTVAITLDRRQVEEDAVTLQNRIKYIQAKVEAKKKEVAKAQRTLVETKQLKQRKKEEEEWLEQQKFDFSQDRIRRVQQRKRVNKLRQEGLHRYQQEVENYKQAQARNYRAEKEGIFDAVKQQKELSMIANKQRSLAIRSEKEKFVMRREKKRLLRLQEARDQKKLHMSAELERKQETIDKIKAMKAMELEVLQQLELISGISSKIQQDLREQRMGNSIQGRKITAIGQSGQTAQQR